MAELDDRLSRLLSRWDDVEGWIKQAELFQGQVTIPAINELRYAGRQIIKAVSLQEGARSEPDPKIKEAANVELLRALSNAEQYVMNADHDVVDGVVVFVTKRVAELNFRFGRDAIARRSAGYSGFCDDAEHCKTEVERSRRVKSKERSEIYAALKKSYLKKLMDSYSAVTNAETIMAAEIDAKDNEIRLAKGMARRRLFGIFALLIVVVVLCALIAYFKR